MQYHGYCKTQTGETSSLTLDYILRLWHSSEVVSHRLIKNTNSLKILMLRLHLWTTYVYWNFNTTILHTNMHMWTFYKSIKKYKISYLFINTSGWKLTSTFRQFNRKVYYYCHRIHWLGLIDRKQRISYWISMLLKQLNSSTFMQKSISSNRRFILLIPIESCGQWPWKKSVLSPAAG